MLWLLVVWLIKMWSIRKKKYEEICAVQRLRGITVKYVVIPRGVLLHVVRCTRKGPEHMNASYIDFSPKNQ